MVERRRWLIIVSLGIIMVSNFSCLQNETISPRAPINPRLLEIPTPTPPVPKGDTAELHTHSQPNLAPSPPPGSKVPLLVTQPDTTIGEPLRLKESTFVTWGITNTGDTSVDNTFYVDLYLDGSLVERWMTNGIPSGSQRFSLEWDGLQNQVRLTPGDHILTLVVDPTGLVVETDKSDNTYSMTVTWEGEHIEKIEQSPQHLPNLAPFTPDNWTSPIRAYSKIDGKEVDTLYTDSTTYVQIAYENHGRSSISEQFLVYLYLDGVVAAKFREDELLTGDRIVTLEWGGIQDVINLTAGVHTLKLVLDATNLVDEASESDNIFTQTVEWTSDTIGPLVQSPTTTPSASELKPLVLPGWGDSLVISDTIGTLSSPAVLVRGRETYLSWALQNTGELPLTSPYVVEIHLDDLLIKRWYRPELESNGIDFVLDWRLASKGTIDAGYHRLSLTVTLIEEGLQNATPVFKNLKELPWVDIPPPPPAPIRGSLEETAALSELLDKILAYDAASDEDASSLTPEVLTIVDAVYYTLYGVSLLDEPLSIHVFNEMDYTTWIQVQCRDASEQFTSQARADYEQICSSLAELGGFMTTWHQQHRIILKDNRSPTELLSSLAHEIGHFRQRILNPALDQDGASINLLALREAQAYAHQVLMLRTLERLTNQKFLTYPLLEGYEQLIEETLDEWTNSREVSEHARGRLLLWLSLLTDPDLRGPQTELLSQGRLSEENAADLFSYLANLSLEKAEGYVSDRLSTLETQLPVIESLSKHRLVKDLPYWQEGPSQLRRTGLLLP